MKIKHKILFSIAMVVLIASAACKKESKCVGGSGGQVTVKATLRHHANDINSLPAYRDTIHVRYDALDYPANGLAGFNATFIGEAGKSYVIVTGLMCGNYYFYATGGDTVFVQHDTTRVSGGLSDNIGQSSGEVDLVIPVNE